MNRKGKKRIVPLFFLTLFFWFVLGFFLFFVDPVIIRDFPLQGTYLPFFVSLFFSLFLSFLLVFSNLRRAFILSSGFILFLYLRLVGLGHLLNAVLLFSFLGILELYFSSSSK